jgi:hypothetical protein
MEDPISYLRNKGYLNNSQNDKSQLLYKRNITTPRDLAPDKALIYYQDGAITKLINLYNIPIVRLKFKVSQVENEIDLQNLINEYNIYSKFAHYNEDPNYTEFSDRKYLFGKYL